MQKELEQLLKNPLQTNSGNRYGFYYPEFTAIVDPEVGPETLLLGDKPRGKCCSSCVIC